MNEKQFIYTFEGKINKAIEIYEKTIEHSATRLREMIERHGHIRALELLMDSADLQKGFKTLRDNGMLDNTLEAVIIRYKDKINNIIDKKAIEVAQFRLNNPFWDE